MRRQGPAATLPKPSREALESMKRPDLQKLCKASATPLAELSCDFGLRANLKSEAMIDMILGAPEPGAPRSRSASVAATRNDATRSRERSTGSMIIHDGSEDEALSPTQDPQSAPDPEPSASRPTRTRKAKDTQFRLGVGRPVVAGGNGARAVTRAKSRRGKARSFQTTEVPIPEESEPLGAEGSPLRESDRNVAACSPTHKDKPLAVSPDHGTSNVQERAETQDTTVHPVLNVPTAAPVTSSDTFNGLNEYVANLLRPLEERIRTQASEVERLTVQMAGTEELKRTVESMTVELEALRLQVTNMDTRVTSIQDRMDATDAAYSQLPSTPKFSTPIVTPAIPRHAVISPMDEDNPGVDSSSLGKRLRASPRGGESERPNLPEEYVEGSPEKKRVRLTTPESSARGSRVRDLQEARSVAGPSSQGDGELQASGLSAAFTIFTGPSDDRNDAQPGPRSSQRLTITSAATSENRPSMPDNYEFSFGSTAWDPVASTPYVAHFPHPQVPQSPTPVMPPSSSSYGHTIERHGRRERLDLFHPLGTPGRPRIRSSDAGTSSLASGFINPASLMRTPSPPHERKVSSNDVGATLGLGRPIIPETPAPPVRRTMYGTELDNDSRFGDFGVEGVATGFWNPGKYNPTSEDFE
ncbi:hypothetical protein NEOLEDRAFT_1144156 [Neolentinus lepideus HHB14362 ss-1]|uniref:Uncharacterized protein n=1 Tax=Neolentinus lepideus HHB14362 ss-1 TaxID=1314782 RepID=A0A165W1N0_9AGAM|nr:hypothetical protein NEOLEDRAFT_1144156 [Neolentinus lepideus HHB14362 ss-1]